MIMNAVGVVSNLDVLYILTLLSQQLNEIDSSYFIL